ncbi:sarcosine oxidase subunit gamma [uncultured Roseobacter sp.]|uniref:sarcosine oxidase subunit gamma n=1 Tax=uncultured Roseobacter sp. TaxID=114847 RepID=UPI00261396F4|nr:sarcosine oxidase subunit gamma family protein [uncultured Roseobacter sp.]
MSEPITALGGAVSQNGIAKVAEAAREGMITLRGDVTSAAVKKALKSVTGAAMPGAGQMATSGSYTLCWMSPDEVLVLCPADTVGDTLTALQNAAGTAHVLVVNVTDARASFTVAGPLAREVMAKLCPVDLAPGAFEPGMFRRTRLAQVAAAVWMPEAERFRIVCFRSQARYVFDVLCVAAQEGSAVGAFN